MMNGMNLICINMMYIYLIFHIILNKMYYSVNLVQGAHLGEGGGGVSII